jgi:hypothetical protein
MDKKLMGTAAVIGVVAGYMYSKDVFNSATFAASDEAECKYGKYRTQPKPGSDTWDSTSYSWATITNSESKGVYTVTHIKHTKREGLPGGRAKKPPSDKESGSKLLKGITAAMKAAKDMSPKGYIEDTTGDYCKMLKCGPHWDDNTGTCPEKPVTEKPSNGDEVTSSGSTDWCAIKAKYPARLKEIKGEIAEERIKIKADYVAAVNKVKDLNRKTSEKFEKEGAAELKRIKDRYEESKKNCSAKEEVQKKLKDTDIGEGFWEKLLAYLNA